ncbi:hypothetical protein ACHQM5_002446 [Ranunculus cassubicifolius]
MEDKGNKEYDSCNLLVGNMSDFEDQLPGVPLDTAIGDLKVTILTKIGELRGFSNNFTRVADPELMAIVAFHTDGFPCSHCSQVDTQSLRDYLSDVGYFSSPLFNHAKPLLIELRLVRECTWYELANAYAKAKKSREAQLDDCDGDGDYYADIDEESDLDDVLITQRPCDKLVEDKKMLRVVGKLHVESRLNNDTIKRRPVGYMGGLPCDLKDVVKMTTTAKHVILATTAFNHDLLNMYHAHLNLDIHNDPNDIILVLLVTWDKFSYLFLRKLRKSIGSDVPIIAITDSNLHDLDLLAFLDTPPQQVASLYGWDLSQDCVALGLMDVVVDVKWAGLRPSETQNQTLAPTTHAVAVSSRDYGIICNKLKHHPRLVEKPKWLQELALFEKQPLYLLHFFGMSNSEIIFSKYFREKYIPDKLAKKDWI